MPDILTSHRASRAEAFEAIKAMQDRLEGAPEAVLWLPEVISARQGLARARLLLLALPRWCPTPEVTFTEAEKVGVKWTTPDGSTLALTFPRGEIAFEWVHGPWSAVGSPYRMASGFIHDEGAYPSLVDFILKTMY